MMDRVLFTEEANGYKFVGRLGDFANLEYSKVSQCYGVVFNRAKKVLIVYHKRGEWQLPGGKLEQSETYTQAVFRECKEEANIELTLDSIKAMFYQEVYKQNEDGFEFISYQLRFFAKLRSEKPFLKDKDESITDKKWVKIDDLDKYLLWGQAVQYIQK
jgi:8-oxo-dGTP pyrophosphatase MutT (NUDIX family)